jgi:hypothetical protein
MYLKHVPKARITFLMPPPPHPTPQIIIQFFVEEIKEQNLPIISDRYSVEQNKTSVGILFLQ